MLSTAYARNYVSEQTLEPKGNRARIVCERCLLISTAFQDFSREEQEVFMQKVLLCVLATALVIGGATIAAAQNVGGGQTVTPQTAPNPDDPAVRNPQSATSSNRGDPGALNPSRSEALNPSIGGPALGQGRQPAGTVGQAP